MVADVRLPMGLDVAFVGIVFYSIGYLIGKLDLLSYIDNNVSAFFLGILVIVGG